MSPPPRPLYTSSSSSSPKERHDDDQISSACEQLHLVLDNLAVHIQDNLYLRGMNARLRGETVLPPPDYSDSNGGGVAAERDARELLLEISNVMNSDGYEKGSKNELLENLKKSFGKIDGVATELYAKNEEWRQVNEDAGKKNRPQQRGEEEGELEKKGDGRDLVYQDMYDDDNAFESTTLPVESSKRYDRLWSAHDKALTQLQDVIDNFNQLEQENRYLRRVNAELNGDKLSPPVPPDDDRDRVAETLEARKLLEAFVPNDEDGLEELIRKVRKSFEEVDCLAAELIAENEEWRRHNDCLDPNWVQRFEQAWEAWEEEEQEKKRKEEARYQEDRDDDDDRTLPGEEESEETYKQLCSAQVRAFDHLACILGNLDEHIQENQYLRNVNAELNGNPSPPPPGDRYIVAEAAAEEARQLLLETSSRVPQNDEQQDLKKVVQNLKRKVEEIGRLTADVIRENEEWKVLNGFLREYGPQRFERQSDIKEVVTAPGPAPRDQGRNDDDLREKNRILQARLLAMEAAMKDAGKTTRASITPILSSLGNTTTSKELENVPAALVTANVRINQPRKTATASSHHHLPCPVEPELKDVRAALVAANARIGELETATPASSHHLPCPNLPKLEKTRKALVAANVRIGELEKKVAKQPSTKELENVRAALVAANVRIGELEKQVAEEPTPHIPSRPSTPPLPPPKPKTTTVGSSAALAAANERIVELENQLAIVIAKTAKANLGGKALSSPGPKPEENVETSSTTAALATTPPLVLKAAVDPEATDNSPPQYTLCPAQLFIRRASLPSSTQQLKRQVKSIDSFKRPNHSSSASSSPPPNDAPAPSATTEPLHFLRSASKRLRWLIGFFVLFMMLMGVILCWIKWAGLNRERAMWLGANEDSRMEVEGEIAKAWRSWDRVGIVFCFDRGLSLRLLKLLLPRRGAGGILFVS